MDDLSPFFVYQLITCTEKSLRSLVVQRCESEWGNSWQDKLSNRYPLMAQQWLFLQAKDAETLSQFHLPSGSLVEYSTFGELKQIILAEWLVFKDVFQFKKTGGKDNKKAFDDLCDEIIEVRNRLAHNRATHPHQKRKARVACDEIALQISNWMGIPCPASQEEQFHPKQPAIRYFLTLDEYLNSPGSFSPKINDFTQDLVYLSPTHARQITNLLEEKNRCLLVGRAAAGKTVLAIALGKKFQTDTDTAVYYIDASRAQAGDGRNWYLEILSENTPKRLYILDNCHLAPNEINNFCFQWGSQKSPIAKILLIMREGATGTLDLLDDISNYDSTWSYVVVTIRPEEIYQGIINKYSSYIQKSSPNNYVLPENDSYELIESQHAHNLIASKSRLELWHKIGGRLSDVSSEAVYQALAKKYLHTASETLISLCTIWQFEVPTHYAFVEKKSAFTDIELLERLQLVHNIVSPGYGTLFFLNIHSEEARELFHASIYCKWGKISRGLLETEILNRVKAYLLCQPQNYVYLFDRLFRFGYKNLEVALLLDKEVQSIMPGVLISGKISDAVKYLFDLYRVASEPALKLLSDLVQSQGMDNICSQLSSYSLHDFQFTLFYIQRMNCNLAQNIIDGINIEHVSKQATRDNLYNISWCIRTLARISKPRANLFLEKIPFEQMALLIKTSNVDTLERLLTHIYRFGLSYSRITDFINQVNNNIGIYLENPNNDITVFSKLIRAIKPFSAELALTAKHAYHSHISTQHIMDSLSHVPIKKATYYLKSNPAIFEKYINHTFKNIAKKEPFPEIVKFISYTRRSPNNGDKLALKVLSHVNIEQIISHVRQKDLGYLNSLILTVAEINKGWLKDLFLALDPVNLGIIFEANPLHDVSFFIHLVELHYPKYLEVIREVLMNTSPQKLVTAAEVSSLGYFLEVVSENIDIELAESFCQVIDKQDWSNSITRCDWKDLRRFLWNFTQLGQHTEGQVFHNRALIEYIRDAWEKDLLVGLELLGIAHAGSDDFFELSALPSQFDPPQYALLLKELPILVDHEDPLVLIRTLSGLFCVNPGQAKEICSNYLPLYEATGRAADALEQATTSRGMSMIQNIYQLLSQMLFEHTIQTLDLMVAIAENLESVEPQPGGDI